MKYVNNKMPVACWKFKVADPLSSVEEAAVCWWSFHHWKMTTQLKGATGENLLLWLIKWIQKGTSGTHPFSTLHNCRIFLQSSYTWQTRLILSMHLNHKPVDRSVQRSNALLSKEWKRGTRLAQSEEHATLDLQVLNSSPTLGVRDN